MKPVEVAAGLVFRDGKLLITQRHLDAHVGGLWEFPGGKREPGETFPECLARELREELGIEVEVLDRIEAIEHAYPEKVVLLEFFRCRWLAHEPQPLGCPALAWVRRDEMDQYQFPGADARLIARLKSDAALWT